MLGEGFDGEFDKFTTHLRCTLSNCVIKLKIYFALYEIIRQNR